MYRVRSGLVKGRRSNLGLVGFRQNLSVKSVKIWTSSPDLPPDFVKFRQRSEVKSGASSGFVNRYTVEMYTVSVDRYIQCETVRVGI